ncbi:MAG: triose-phosphate isomerase [Deltaproteobacteria bacterium]|nr:triose-phosphate isomerase [Deltaproteobacteria bacterium]
MEERKPLIAGNWKMNLDIGDAVNLVRSIGASLAAGGTDREVLIAPPFTSLQAVKEAIGDSRIFLAGQNMHWEMKGAYTGEISGRMLQQVGCTHVILGHSERRTLFRETSNMVDLKVKSAVLLGLIPIVCIGESLEERESDRTFAVLEDQLNASLQNFRADELMPGSTILAYEPIWAIGTGKTATPEQAQEVHAFIREWIEKTFGQVPAREVRILYGGSVKPSNIEELMSMPDIDGVLVGGASLKADQFIPIIHYGT